MASTITAGNATNALAIASDNTGILEFKTGPGSGTTAMTLDTSGNVSGVIKAGTLRTAVTDFTTSTTYTGLPSTAKRITVMFDGIALSGTDHILVQLGDSGGVETTDYISSSANQAGTVVSSTSGFIVTSGSASNIISGTLVITAMGSNSWVASHTVKLTTTSTGYGGGDKTLSPGPLTQISITRTGTDTFTAGTINILYE